MEKSKYSDAISKYIEKFELSYVDSNLLGRGGVTTSTSTSSVDSIRSNGYDVFISFRGCDTRNTFVDHLYSHLVRKGILTFKDDKELQKGESISPQLSQAIKHSRVSIIVFSKDYASSTWCLDEMSDIADCRSELKQIVFPVFYDVDPSHVRKQIGVYESAFVSHTKKFGYDLEKVARWRRAMTCLAESAGWDVRNKQESSEIEHIVQTVIKKLGHKFSKFAKDLIGIQPRVEELESLLKLNSKKGDVQVLGVWGMGGIGKTTLASVLYDRISYQFDASCFIENFSEIYRNSGGRYGGATAVHKRILCQTMDEKNLDVYSPSEVSGIVMNRLCNKKLLVVLDNVDEYEQLLELNLDPKSLLAGSRIIITTRDNHILTQYDADEIYEAQLMDENDAHKLLCRKAFKDDYLNSPFGSLVHEVLKHAQLLPLAIGVMGSFLYKRDAKQWRATLDGWQHNPNSGIMKMLQTSFEGLELREKETFLHIACFFQQERDDYVRKILDACGLYPNIGIPLLAEKSLITLRNGEIHMHAMLQELGKQVVRGQHPDEPGFWNRLWLYRDFHRAMLAKTGEIEVKAIVLDQKEDGFNFNKLSAEDLSKMGQLKLLVLYHKNFSGSPISLSNSLYYFSWDGYPFTSMPLDFQPSDLVELNMPNSSVEKLWTGIQHLPCLKRMDLSNSKNLSMTPSFEGIRNLERLDFTGCTNLSQVDPSVGLLTKLVFLSLQNCSSLVTLEFNGVSSLSSLRVLRLSGCTKLKNSPDFTRAFNVEYLDMDQCTSLSTIHESIEALVKLRFLSLRCCTNLVGIPDGLNNMISLTTLDLYGCLKFVNLPLRFFNCSIHLEYLIFLDLSFCNISEVPDAIGELGCLERLNLQGNNFVTLPSSIDRLYGLAYLNLSHCHSLEYLPKLPTESAPLFVGRYFKTTSGSRDNRSGLYVFDCPKVAERLFSCKEGLHKDRIADIQFEWVQRLIKEPRHFRCGFDIVLPWHWTDMGCHENPVPIIPHGLDHRYNGGLRIWTQSSDMHFDWLGFVFCVAFEVNNCSAVSGSSHQSPLKSLPYPFYLSFESQHTEERFDMPLNLEQSEVHGSKYLWMIYISREHCHFVKSGVQITFKALQNVIMKECGLHVVTKEDIEASKWKPRTDLPLQILEMEESSSSSFEPKIQLPYNWLVSVEECVENDTAKGKEIDLFNLGLLTGPQ